MNEVARPFQTGLNLLSGLKRSAAAGYQFLRVERGDVVQRLRPVFEVGVTGIRCRIELHQVATEKHLLRRNPGNDVALGGVSSFSVQ